MKKLHVFSKADMAKGHGVLSAYEEQVKLSRKVLKGDYEIEVNPKKLGDINHYHTINLGFYLKNKFFGKNSVSVGYVHFLPETIDESIQMPSFARKVFYWYILKFYKSMDYLVVVNPYFIELMKKYGIDTSRTVYIPNLVSNDKFERKNEEEKIAIRKKMGLEDRFVVLGVGQLQVRKGIFDFVKLAERNPDMDFIWAGGYSFGRSSDGYKEIKKLEENPPKNMKFLGIVERNDMTDYYNIADVMLLPSFSELFPMTILEAMATNTPVLLRDLDIYPLILDGYYLKASDMEGFEKELYKIRDDKDYRQKAIEMSKKGHDFYSEESVGKMWREFYDNISK